MFFFFTLTFSPFSSCVRAIIKVLILFKKSTLFKRMTVLTVCIRAVETLHGSAVYLHAAQNSDLPRLSEPLHNVSIIHTADLPDTTPFLKFRFFKSLDPCAKTNTTKPNSLAAWSLLLKYDWKSAAHDWAEGTKIKNQLFWEKWEGVTRWFLIVLHLSFSLSFSDPDSQIHSFPSISKQRVPGTALVLKELSLFYCFDVLIKKHNWEGRMHMYFLPKQTLVMPQKLDSTVYWVFKQVEHV